MKEAIRILRLGGLVAFPTETVYGLGADATNSQAVEKIFAAKGRLPTNPLIVHVADGVTARRFAASWPAQADRLAAAFWPGPLALILPKNPIIVDQATAGRPTVALRVPDHPIALHLLREFGGAIAAPSANRSTRVSPTTAEHVRRDLGDKVDLILDGGPCRVGIESTVLDLTQNPPMILRPGGISRERIQAVIGPVDLFEGKIDESQPAASPGQQELHYSPQKPAFRFDFGDWTAVVTYLSAANAPVAILLMSGPARIAALNSRMGSPPMIFQMPANFDAYASRLYAALREADDANISAIWIELPPDRPEWTAVRDRILRATRANFGITGG